MARASSLAAATSAAHAASLGIGSAAAAARDLARKCDSAASVAFCASIISTDCQAVEMVGRAPALMEETYASARLSSIGPERGSRCWAV
eukprot:scaffold24248_cov79-Isochrysis_galbana.AAC.1